MTRKFYRTVIQFEILSEEPLTEPPLTLEQINYETMDGHCSGQFLETAYETVDGKRMAELLQKQGSDPEFFNLSETGDDLEEDAA